jgi:hypothetical protein
VTTALTFILIFSQTGSLRLALVATLGYAILRLIAGELVRRSPADAYAWRLAGAHRPRAGG